MLSGQLAHERTLANRRKPYKSNTGYACPSNIKSSYEMLAVCIAQVFNPLTAPSTSARGRGQQLSLELGKFCLQLTQMKAGGLVFLRLGHLFLYRFDLWRQGVSADDMYSHAGTHYLVRRGRHLECALYAICPQQVLSREKAKTYRHGWDVE